MEINFSTLLNILAQPPGDLIFHLVVSLALILMVVITLTNFRKSQRKNLAKRTLIGCGIILLMQLLLLAFRPLNQEITFNTGFFFPLFERLSATLTIAWLVWLFSDDDQSCIPTNLNIFLSFAIIIFAAVSIIVIPTLARIPNFNLYLINLLWQFIALVLILIGFVLAFITMPSQRWVMIPILLVLAIGHILQIIMQNSLQWNMGAVRLAQTLSLPWILTLIQRFSKDEDQEEFQEIESDIGYPEMPVDTRPALVKLLLQVNLTKTVEEKYQAIARALSLSVIADICLLVKIPKEGEKLHIISGYDLIRETFQKPDTLVKEDLPRIMAAWQANQVLELSQDRSKTRDAVTLAMLLSYHGIGNLFAYPIGLPGKPLTGGVIFLSPYTGKVWGKNTRRLMDENRDILGQIMFSSNTEEQARLVLGKVQIKMNALIEERNQLRQALSDKENHIRKLETTLKELKAKYQIEKMETVTNIDKMKTRIADLSSKLASQRHVSEQLEQMKSTIRQLSSEREQLSLALSRANAAVRDLQTQTGQTGPIRLSLDSQIISLDSIAANIRLRVASQLQQKDIELEIHNPDGRQMIKTDPGLLQTALLELTTNAIKASQPGATIRLDQKLSFEMGMLIIQVTDFGEGLSEAEQTALFSAKHNTIPGIGEVQYIRKAIRAIRVLNGKVWLKSKKESYTTFRFQIPVRIID